jgi:hypothetical protein
VKTFLRKLKLSFLAMLCGWVACNIAWWVGAIPILLKPGSSLRSTDFMMISSFTGIVVMIAWVVIFLPTDLVVTDASTLRRPRTAARCGFLASFVIVAAVFAWAAWFEVVHHGLLPGLWRTLDKAALPYALGTCATGSVAAYARALMDKPQALATP